MIREPFFPTTDKYKDIRLLMTNFDFTCIECTRPVFKRRPYCTPCLIRLYATGFEHRRVKLSKVGNDTVNYQQHLHRVFFGCNAPIKYRGKKENRIRANTNCQSDIDKAAKKLDLFLRSKTFTYKNKRRTKHPLLVQTYNSVSEVRNIQRRLIYNLTLYYIHYYILQSKEYIHLAHFQASVTNHLYHHIERTFIRTNPNGNTIRGIKQKRLSGCSFNLYPYTFELIESIIKPLIVKLYH